MCTFYSFLFFWNRSSCWLLWGQGFLVVGERCGVNPRWMLRLLKVPSCRGDTGGEHYGVSLWNICSFMKLCEATVWTKGCLSLFLKVELRDPGEQGTLWEATAWGDSLLCHDVSTSCRTGTAWFLSVVWVILDPLESKGEPGSCFWSRIVIQSPSSQSRCPFSWWLAGTWCCQGLWPSASCDWSEADAQKLLGDMWKDTGMHLLSMITLALSP